MKKLLLYSLIATVFMSMTLAPKSKPKNYSIYTGKYSNSWNWYFAPPPPTFTEKDTIVTVATGITWKMTFRAPDNLYSKNGVDSGSVIIFFVGAGESSSNAYGDASLAKYGPLDYVHSGWDGGVVLGNGTHYPIIIHISQQPSVPAASISKVTTAISQILSRFRIKSFVKNGIRKQNVFLTGLSAGGGTLKEALMSDTSSTARKVASFVDVEGMKPDDFCYPTCLGGVARAGVRGWFIEGGNDGRDQGTQVTTMNNAVANSARYTVTVSTDPMWNHTSWNWIYGGNGSGVLYSTPKTYNIDGIVQNCYQFMYRQGDTTITTSTGIPAASAGEDRTIFYTNPTTTLDGTNSVDGNGTITSYSWSKVSGPSTYNLTSGGWLIANASNLVQGTYGFELSVTDNDGNTAKDTVYVNVQAPPTVNAGTNQQVNSSSATLAASSSDEGSIVKNLVQIFRVPGQPVVKIGFIGSSTAFGYGVSADSTIEYILNQRLQALGVTNANIVNLGVSSTDFWNGLATNTPIPATGHAPDTSKNLNAAKARGCNIILWLYTTNALDYPETTWPVFYDAYQKARDSAVAMGMKFLCITPKTRDGFSPTEEQKLHDFKDSLLKFFPNEIINVWDGFTASPTTTASRPEFDRGDLVHWNGQGHVQAVKQIIPKLAKTIREMYPTTTTVTTPSSLTTTITGMSPGAYTIIVSAQDNDSLWNNATMTITDTASGGGGGGGGSSNCRTGTKQVYTLARTSSTEVYLKNGGQYNSHMGGDTLKIPAGNYDLISLGAISGDVNCPVVITNSGGRVYTKELRIAEDVNSPVHYVKFVGQGGYGFFVGDSTTRTNKNGVSVGYADHVDISGIEVTGTEVGFYYKPIPDATKPGTQYPNIFAQHYIHHNYVHNVFGEGFYVGDTYPNFDPYTSTTPARQDSVEIAYNIVDGTDWDGIQLSNARRAAKIHDNTVLNFGRLNIGGQQAGIILGGNTTGDVYNNIVRFGTGNGIQGFGYGNINIYGNTVEGVGNDGTVNGQQSIFFNDPTNTNESNPHQVDSIYNNIIIHPKTGLGVIRCNNDNGTTDRFAIYNNQFCFNTTPVVGWDGSTNGVTYLMSSAAVTSRSGNTTYNCEENQSPVAKINAGLTSITVILPITTTALTGIGSFDLDGSIASYSWTKTSGPSGGTITSASASTTTITSLQEGTYVFTLTVTDDLGATDDATITVNVIQPITRYKKSNLQIKYRKQ